MHREVPLDGHWQFQGVGGGRGVFKAKILKVGNKLNWTLQMGGRVGRGKDIF